MIGQLKLLKLKNMKNMKMAIPNHKKMRKWRKHPYDCKIPKMAQ